MIAALALLWVASPANPQSSPGAEASVSAIFARLQSLQQAERGQPADVIRELDAQAAALGAEVARLGPDAAAALSRVAADPARPPKTRLFAASFLGLLRDPGAFIPLSRLALSPGSDDVRALAAQSLGGCGVSLAARRRVACRGLEQPDLGPQTRRALLLETAAVGCDDPDALVRLAMSLGKTPTGAPGEEADLCLRALGRSLSPRGAAALRKLALWYPAGSEQRLRCVELAR